MSITNPIRCMPANPAANQIEAVELCSKKGVTCLNFTVLQSANETDCKILRWLNESGILCRGSVGYQRDQTTLRHNLTVSDAPQIHRCLDVLREKGAITADFHELIFNSLSSLAAIPK